MADFLEQVEDELQVAREVLRITVERVEALEATRSIAIERRGELDRPLTAEDIFAAPGLTTQERARRDGLARRIVRDLEPA